MKIFMEKAGLIFLTLFVAVIMTAAPSFAGMGGGSGSGSGSGGASGSGGGSGSSMGGSMGNDADRQDMGSGSGYSGQMMDREEPEGGQMDISSMPMISTGSLGSGDMTMEVTPVRYKDGRLEVKYKANTHSVSLGRYDLMELSTLEVDGKVYKPIKVDGMSGHHAGGQIVFEVPESPDQFRIVIRDIPQVKERPYDWN